VAGGFSFAIDQARLASASVSALALPATTCTLDANFTPVSCSTTTIGVDVSWTGQGPISRLVSNDHFDTNGFSVNDHFNGTSRDAAATGTIAGFTLNAANVETADLGTTKTGTISVCIGKSC
jgi:hypothetical protein